MRAAERFGNLVARHAYGLVRPGTGKGTKAPTPARLAEVRQMALKASGHLEGLARAKPSFERLNLLASAYKRLVMIEQLMGAAMANEAVAHLARMVEVYGQAADLAKTNDKLDWFYPAQNLLAAQVRRALADPRAPAPDAALRQAIIEDLDRRAENDKAGWALVGQAEMALHGALLDRSAQGPARIAKALDGFVKLHERLPAAPVWGSVSDQLDFLLGKPAPALAAVVERVRAFAG
jgi:hypothetical protein